MLYIFFINLNFQTNALGGSVQLKTYYTFIFFMLCTESVQIGAAEPRSHMKRLRDGSYMSQSDTQLVGCHETALDLFQRLGRKSVHMQHRKELEGSPVISAPDTVAQQVTSSELSVARGSSCKPVVGLVDCDDTAWWLETSPLSDDDEEDMNDDISAFSDDEEAQEFLKKSRARKKNQQLPYPILLFGTHPTRCGLRHPDGRVTEMDGRPYVETKNVAVQVDTSEEHCDPEEADINVSLLMSQYRLSRSIKDEDNQEVCENETDSNDGEIDLMPDPNRLQTVQRELVLDQDKGVSQSVSTVTPLFRSNNQRAITVYRMQLEDDKVMYEAFSEEQDNYVQLAMEDQFEKNHSDIIEYVRVLLEDYVQRYREADRSALIELESSQDADTFFCYLSSRGWKHFISCQYTDFRQGMKKSLESGLGVRQLGE